MNGTQSRTLWWVLLVLPVLCYARMLGHGFVAWDDAGYITENPMVRAGLSRPGVMWALTTFTMANWHPLTWLSHMLDCQVFGLHGGGHHLVGLLWHSANTLLLGLALLRLTGCRWRSLLCAALFAVHPLHVESVAWASERKDLLSMFFGLLALVAYAAYVRRGGVARYLAVLLCLSLSLCAKPMFVTLPCLLLLLDAWPLRRLPSTSLAQDLPRLVLEKIPLLLVAALSCAVTILAQDLSGAVQPLSNLSLGDRLLTAISGYGWYLYKMVWPSDLAFFYPAAVGHPGWPLSAAVVLALTALSLGTWRSRPYLLVGWLWYLGTLVPVIGLVQVGAQAVADRYSYLPLCGIFIMLVWSLPEWPGPEQRRQRVLVATGVALVLAMLSLGTVRQVGHWRSSYTLFLHGAQVTQRNHIALTWLGVELYKRGQSQQAMARLAEAQAARPSYAMAPLWRGFILLQQGAVPEGLAALERGIVLDPKSDVALDFLYKGLARQSPATAARACRDLAAALLSHSPDTAPDTTIDPQTDAVRRVALDLYQHALQLDPRLAP